MADRRRAGILAVLLVLAGGLTLAVWPGPGSARIFGVGLLWWYCAVAAPALALLATIIAMPLAPLTIAAAVSPVVVASLLGRVFTGAPEAPLLVLAAAVGPLLGVLVGPSPPQRDRIAAAVVLASAGLLVWAGLLLAGDLALLVDRPRWHGVGLAAAVALAAGVRAVGRLRTAVLGAAIVVLAAPVLALTLSGLAPWQAWAALASRPALLFAERSPAATAGTVLRRGTTVELDESHRVTALSRAVYRVLERDSEAPAVREWRLDPGDALMLRPGDRLELAAGAHVRFEAGKRIPGAPVSGMVWADPLTRDHDVAVDVAAAALTLAAGAAALVTVRRAPTGAVAAKLSAIVALLVPPALALLAVCWGVYAANAVPEIGLGAPPIAALTALPGLVPRPFWPGATLLAALGALAALFAANVNALAERVRDFGGAGPEGTRHRLVWTAIVGLAAGLALPAFDAWQALTWGWGLAASAILAPALAGAGAKASRVAAIVGGLVFIAVAVGGRTLVPWAPAVADYPALAAMPAAWAVAAAFGRRLPARRAVRAAR